MYKTTAIISSRFQALDLLNSTNCNFRDLRDIDSTTLTIMIFIQACKVYGSQSPRCGKGWGWLAPRTFDVVSAKFLSYQPKTVSQILIDSFLTVAFCQTVRREVSAKFQPLPLLKNIESPNGSSGLVTPIEACKCNGTFSPRKFLCRAAKILCDIKCHPSKTKLLECLV